MYIIGAGSVGGHVAMNFETYQAPFHLVGFLDDDPNKAGGNFCGLPVIDTVDLLLKKNNVAVVLGIAFPKIKSKIVERLEKNNTLEFPTLVSSKAWVSKGVSFEKGCVIYPGCSINYGSKLGAFIVMNMNCAIGHDTSIGNFTSLAPGVNLGGNTQLGNLVDMGIGSATRQFVKISDGSTIGGQSMVVRNLDISNTVYAGVPAEKLT
ncbi:MAG: acetyltransferase [Mameliella sp.]|nr:acetyltransferase [Phaeodactylibacter sp.]